MRVESRFKQTVEESLQDLSTKPSQTRPALSLPLAQEAPTREPCPGASSGEDSPIEDELLGFGYYPQLKQSILILPLIEEVKDLIYDEWKKVNRKSIFANKFKKM